MQADTFLVVSAACPAMDPRDCRLNKAAERMAALRFPSSCLADIACARRVDGDLLFWRVRSGVVLYHIGQKHQMRIFAF